MINNFLRKAGLGLLSGSLIFLSFTGCKNNAQIDLNMIPDDDNFKFYVDSASMVTASTLRQDSVASRNGTTSLLGCMNDPVFGQSTAGLLTQIRLTSNEVTFGVNPQIDSVILELKYQGSYGDTTTLQTVRIYELTKDLYYDSVYYSNMDAGGFYDKTSPVADFSFLPEPNLKDSLLIRLSDELGTKLLNADTSFLSNNDVWLTFFKGLYLEAQPVYQGGAIVYFDFTGGESMLTLYFHNDVADSLRYDLAINTNAAWVNLFSHDYAGAVLKDQINDSVTPYDKVYLQSMAGLRSHLKLDLSRIIDSIFTQTTHNITVNKADLIIPLAEDPTVGSFASPGGLWVFTSGITAGKDTYFQGFFDEATSTYRFSLVRYMQKILHPDPAKRIENIGLYMIMQNETTSANRVILKNGTVPGGIKLVITYTPVL